MSRATNSPIRVSPGSLDASSSLSTAVSLAPLPAREAVGRATGIGRASLVTTRTPSWRSAGVVGLVALVAAAALPVMASIFAIPL